MAIGTNGERAISPRRGQASLAADKAVQSPVVRLWSAFLTHGPLLGVLATAACLNFWNLGANGYGNTYYAAAVRSMRESWHNFFFVSFDPGGFISVDKPPVALWVQALSARVFGFSGTSILVPEALAGVAAVFVLYLAVSRVFGRTAGLVAGIVLALTPIAVAINRSNNLDAWLAFVTVGAAYCVVRALERGSLRWLVLSALMIGVAFNTKTLAGLVAAPALFAAYAVTAPVSVKLRLRNLAVAGVVLVAVSAAWVAAVDLTPASARPYVGGSQENSELDLLLNYNGLGRIEGQGGPGFGGNGPNGPMPSFAPQGLPEGTTLPPGSLPPGIPPIAMRGGGGVPGGGGFGGGETGLTRLFNDELSAQASWLLPLALIGGLGALTRVGRRLSGNQELGSMFVWGGWLLTAAAVFSRAEGIFHPYYLAYLGPAIGGVVGISVASFIKTARAGGTRQLFALAAILATAAFEVSVLRLTPDYNPWLVPAVLAPVVLSIAVLGGGMFNSRLTRFGGAALAVGIAALLLPPLVWSHSLTAQPGNATIPYVSPSAGEIAFGGPGGFGGGPGGDSPANQGLIDYLQANRGNAKFLFATESSMGASGAIIETGEPVMATGGFSGGDPALTIEQLAAMVEAGTLRYYLVGGFGGPGGAGMPRDRVPGVGPVGALPADGFPAGAPPLALGDAPAGPGAGRGLSTVVAKVGKLVDPAEYGGSSSGQLYDLQGTAAALRSAGGQ